MISAVDACPFFSFPAPASYVPSMRAPPSRAACEANRGGEADDTSDVFPQAVAQWLQIHEMKCLSDSPVVRRSLQNEVYGLHVNLCIVHNAHGFTVIVRCYKAILDPSISSFTIYITPLLRCNYPSSDSLFCGCPLVCCPVDARVYNTVAEPGF